MTRIVITTKGVTLHDALTVEVYMHSDLVDGKRWVVALVASWGIHSECLSIGILLIFRVVHSWYLIIGYFSVNVSPYSIAGGTSTPWSIVLAH